METRRRTVAKALTWQVMGLIVMTAITYAVTGSITDGGMVALAGAASGIVFYVLHERIWANIAWGLNRDRETASRHREVGPS